MGRKLRDAEEFARRLKLYADEIMPEASDFKRMAEAARDEREKGIERGEKPVARTSSRT